MSVRLAARLKQCKDAGRTAFVSFLTAGTEPPHPAPIPGSNPAGLPPIGVGRVACVPASHLPPRGSAKLGCTARIAAATPASDHSVE